MKLLAQIFGIIGMIVNSLSVQHKEKRKIMLFQLIANVMYTLQYICLKAYSGAASATAAILRSYFFKTKENNKKRLIKVILLIILLLIIGITTYSGYISLIPIILGILTIISACYCKSKTYKLLYGIFSIIWIFYNYKVKAYICAIDCTLCTISSFIGYFKEK